MPSATPNASLGYVHPRVKADGSGLEWCSLSEVLLEIASATQPPVGTRGTIYLDTSAVPIGNSSTDILSDTIPTAESRVDRFGAREVKAETVTPAETVADYFSHAGASVDTLTEPVGVTEAKADPFAGIEAKSETVAASESESDSYTPAAGSTGITRVGVSAVTAIPTAQSAAVPIPGPVLAGDIIVIYANAANTPTGFTYKNSTTAPISYLYWKRAAGGETSVTVGTGAGGGNGMAVSAVYRGCIATGDPFDLCFYAGGATASATAAPTPATAGAMLLFGALFLTYDSAQTIVPNASWNATTSTTGDVPTTLAQSVNPSPNAISGQAGITLYESGVINPSRQVALTVSFSGGLDTKQIKLMPFALKPA